LVVVLPNSKVPRGLMNDPAKNNLVLALHADALQNNFTLSTNILTFRKYFNLDYWAFTQSAVNN
jgi:hypothetical protein